MVCIYAKDTQRAHVCHGTLTEFASFCESISICMKNKQQNQVKKTLTINMGGMNMCTGYGDVHGFVPLRSFSARK